MKKSLFLLSTFSLILVGCSKEKTRSRTQESDAALVTATPKPNDAPVVPETALIPTPVVAPQVNDTPVVADAAAIPAPTPAPVVNNAPVVADTALIPTATTAPQANDPLVASTATAPAATVGAEIKDSLQDQAAEWKLNASDLKTELEKDGQIVRTKSASAIERVGETLDSARIVTVINGKLIAEPQLSAFKINVDADNGVVTLKGTVKSIDLIGRAVGLALETEGVSKVVSTITVE